MHKDTVTVQLAIYFHSCINFFSIWR